MRVLSVLVLLAVSAAAVSAAPAGPPAPSAGDAFARAARPVGFFSAPAASFASPRTSIGAAARFSSWKAASVAPTKSCRSGSRSQSALNPQQSVPA